MTQPTEESHSKGIIIKLREQLSEWLSLAWDYFAFLVLILISLFGALYPMFHQLSGSGHGVDPEVAIINAMQHEVSVILHVLGALSLVIGIGLFHHFRRVEKHFSTDEAFSAALKKHFESDQTDHNKIKEDLKENQKFLLNLLGGRFLSNYKEIYSCLISLATNAETEIQLLVYGQIWLDKQPDSWSEELANHLKTQRDNYLNDINYKVVACLSMQEQHEFFDTLKKRLDIYEQHEVSDLVKLRLIDDNKPIGLNVLIIDRKHVALTFPHHGENEVNSCIIFEGRDEIAQRLASWFDDGVFNQAASFESVLKELKTKQNQ
ncbi:hypothetical protein [Nitrosomonas sp. Nm166]|uniref:hypothetical protein n=1 Tax=Nitrosomonas sp. Nm166 TaxID=1881054 RepID=UPI0008ED28B3|nr:hypothetical protein [Nitrosomonas sp. Nm166]SFE31409.1 hypothetical protein SAMN05428977_101230 [Nitrosomonas sp. Nm166]